KNAFANFTASGIMRSLSGLITPPGKCNASKSSGRACCKGMSTGNLSPHSVKFHARTWPSLGETMLVFAPAWSKACRGFTISTCSKPSAIRMATFIPLISVTFYLHDKYWLILNARLRGFFRTLCTWQLRRQHVHFFDVGRLCKQFVRL